MLGRLLLQKFHACHQHPRIAGNGTAGLDEDLQAAVSQLLLDGVGVSGGQRWLLRLVANAQPAAQVQMPDLNIAFGEPVDQHQQAIQCIEKRRERGEL